MSEREEVKRYGFYGDYGYCRCRIEEFDDGDLVSYDDYAALRSQLAQVERERENVSSQLWDCTNERDGYKHRAERMERVVEALKNPTEMLVLQAAEAFGGHRNFYGTEEQVDMVIRAAVAVAEALDAEAQP